MGDYIVNRIERLLVEAREAAWDEAYRAVRPETSMQLDELKSGEAGLSTAEKAERRKKWLKMPVGRGHRERFFAALREDQGLDEDDEPAQALNIELRYSPAAHLAKAKRKVQAELKNKFGIDVHMRTITRAWNAWKATDPDPF